MVYIPLSKDVVEFRNLCSPLQHVLALRTFGAIRIVRHRIAPHKPPQTSRFKSTKKKGLSLDDKRRKMLEIVGLFQRLWSKFRPPFSPVNWTSPCFTSLPRCHPQVLRFKGFLSFQGLGKDCDKAQGHQCVFRAPARLFEDLDRTRPHRTFDFSVPQSVKEVLDGLVADRLVTCEKIGTRFAFFGQNLCLEVRLTMVFSIPIPRSLSNYYWVRY